MAKYLKLFETHAEYEQYVSGDFEKPNVSHCEDQGDVHYNPMPVIIATDDTNLPLMNIARTYGWIKQDATEFYDSEANNVTNIAVEIVNTFVNTHTQETLDTPYGTYTLDLWYDKDENKWYDTTELFGGNFSLTNISFKRIRPIKSQDGETAKLYEQIDWTNIEHFNEFKYFTSVTTIDDITFYDCTSLTSVIIPDSVTSINENAFYNCSSLTSVTIPNSVSYISFGVFDGCSSLTSVTIPNSVTSIGNEAFRGCGLESLTIGNGVTSINDNTFAFCSGLTNVTIPDNVTSIGRSAFNSCSGLTSVTIGNGVTSIGEYAFSDCTSLTSVTIPDSVTSIGSYAFSDCSGLTSVTIGSGVTSISGYAFYNCSSLISITSLATTAPTIENNTFRDVKTEGTLYVPVGSTGYDVWMGTGNYYLGKYGWTKVER